MGSSAQCKKAESALTEPKASPDAFVAGNARWALELRYRIDAAKETHWALDERERDAILAKLPKNVKPEIMLFKGLGEMMPEQLKATTLDPRRRRALKVTVPNALEAERVLGELMGKDAALRYRFIMERAREADDLLPRSASAPQVRCARPFLSYTYQSPRRRRRRFCASNTAP
jgi:hypothetical protein